MRRSVISIAVLSSALTLVACKDKKQEGKPVPAADRAGKAATGGAPADQVGIAPEKAATAPVIPDDATELADTDTYRIALVAPPRWKAGASDTVTLHIEPKTGWKLNQEFPTKLAMNAPDGVALSKDQLGVGDAVAFVESGAAFAVEVTPSAAGKSELECKLKFAVCTKTTCDPKDETLAFAFDVEAP